MNDFVAKSKNLHFEHEARDYWPCACIVDDNDDTRRHHTMLDECLDLLVQPSIANCLSIGDSRARDAAYTKIKFKCHSTASDLNTSKLLQAVSDGFVDEVKDVDVEAIPYPDSSIDLVIAKETFHHWPRPFLGLYEMIRVAKKYVALIEPFDCLSGSTTPYIEDGQFHDAYEEVGNYKYQLSLREVLKAAWAMGLPAVKAKGFNDPYQQDLTFDKWKIQKQELDLQGEAGTRQFNLMALIIPKDASLLHTLCATGGRTYMPPKNPYL